MPFGGLLAAGVGAGLAKHYISDRPAYEAKRKLAAETTRWSPWTGMVGQVPDEPNAFGSVMQGALSGASMGQNIGAMQQGRDFNDRYFKILESGQAGQTPKEYFGSMGGGSFGPLASGGDYGAGLSSYYGMARKPPMADFGGRTGGYIPS